MAASMDPEIVRKRLVARDSVVPSTQPSVAQCARTFLALQGETGAAAVTAHHAFLRELGALELDYRKLGILARLSEEEILQYAGVDSEIDAQIEAEKAEIAALQAKLEESCRDRLRKEQLEALAAKVNTEAPRVETEREISEVSAQLAELQGNYDAVEEQFQLRRRQFQLLLHSIAELNKSLATS